MFTVIYFKIFIRISVNAIFKNHSKCLLLNIFIILGVHGQRKVGKAVSQ